MSSNGNTSSSANGGIGFTGLLTVLFIALKLTHHVGWSWWWVLSPIWISASVTVVIVVLVLLIALVASSIKDRKGA